MSDSSLANTTSAAQVEFSYRKGRDGDSIVDPIFEEIVTRLYGAIDLAGLRSWIVGQQNTGQRINQSATLAEGAEELSFSWSTPFPDTAYHWTLEPLNDQGAPTRVWVTSKHATSIEFRIVGATNDVTYSIVISQ